MFSKSNVIIYFFMICTANGAILLWSNRHIQISPLQIFDDDSLEELLNKLQNPEVSVYKTTTTLLPEFEKMLEGYHMAYSPNDNISTENVTEIVDQEGLMILENKTRVELEKGTNILSLLLVPSLRPKREAQTDSTTQEPSSPIKGPVLYKGKSNKNIYSLLYSSQPLILQTQNTSIELGDGILVTIDDKQSKNASLRLDATIPKGDEKYILQFLFMWQNTYWSLSTVRVKRTLINSSVNLTISEPFFVPKQFSYHCTGLTVFTDAEKTTELQIYNIQVQPDSKDGWFGDVYDCVDFMTTPILSGLFVTAILGIGLVVALVAISEIKTMDKFDNHKTKQLVITVTE